jgi:hypothetical protein
MSLNLSVRALSPTGDYTFMSTASQFLVNTPTAVGQLVQTRLQLWQGEWFLDNSVGVPYKTQVLGKNTAGTADAAIQNTILTSPGVTGISSYSSTLNPQRQYDVTCTVNTVYGPATITTTV